MAIRDTKHVAYVNHAEEARSTARPHSSFGGAWPGRETGFTGLFGFLELMPIFSYGGRKDCQGI